MTSSGAFLRALFLLAVLQGCCWAQKRQSLTDNGELFSGVRYMNSRVAMPPRSRSVQNRTRPSWGGSYPTIIKTSSPTFTVPNTLATTTTTPRPAQYWRPPARTTTTTTHAPPQTQPTQRPAWQGVRFETIPDYASHTPSTPRMKIERLSGSTNGYLVTIEEADKRRSHRRRYGAHVKPDRYSKAEFGSSSEYRGIKEGSYYDRSSASAPKENRSTVFDWDTTQKHRHRHHHGGVSVAPTYPQRYVAEDVADGYAAFESRGATYSPAATTTRRPYRRRTAAPHLYDRTTTPYPSFDRTTTNRYRRRLDEQVAGGASYHRQQKKRPSGSVHRTSESVSYVSGSYFPTGGGARKPASGFAVRQRTQYAPDPVTPAAPPTFAPVRHHYSPNPVTPSSPPTFTPVRRHYQTDSRHRADEEYEDAGDDNVHPFAAFAGKY